MVDFDTKKSEFNAFFESNRTLFESAIKSFRTLLSLLLSDQPEFSAPEVLGRVKDRQECIKKFERKYLKALEEKQSDYVIQDYLTDIVGLRVVCDYESDIEHIATRLKGEFEILEETNKSEEIEGQEDAFGYKGLHLDMRMNAARTNLPEYRRFKDLRFELQIRTVVQDAWSGLDHKIKYKKKIPILLRRRINRLAALFELADQEFENIRDDTRKYEANPTLQGGGLEGGGDHTSVSGSTPPLDAFQFSRFAKVKFPLYPFDGVKIDGFVSELLDLIPAIGIKDLERYYDDGIQVVSEYVNYQKGERGNSLNPFTQIRHLIYLANKEDHKAILFNLQRGAFDDWLTRRTAGVKSMGSC